MLVNKNTIMIRNILLISISILVLANIYIFVQIISITQMIHDVEVGIETLESTEAIKFPQLSSKDLNSFILSLFPDAQTQQEKLFYRKKQIVIIANDVVIGYVYDVKEDLECPVCSNVRFLVALNREGNIIDLQLIEHLELYGNPMPIDREIEFIEQFNVSDDFMGSNYFSESSKPPFVLGENIDVLTGATKSSKHIVNAINEILLLHHRNPPIIK